MFICAWNNFKFTSKLAWAEKPSDFSEIFGMRGLVSIARRKQSLAFNCIMSITLEDVLDGQ
jgi:hypothetical protein